MTTLSSRDVVDVDLGVPTGREAGFRHPAVVVTAQRVLDETPNVIHVVPLTSRLRDFRSEVLVDSDAGSGLDRPSSAQCQHVRSVAVARVGDPRGTVGAVTLSRIRETIGLLLDIGA
ncbi:MAG: type II toxin-antitoxin system PemK/MazF family toxin [Kineosporiaceae bacterium]